MEIYSSKAKALYLRSELTPGVIEFISKLNDISLKIGKKIGVLKEFYSHSIFLLCLLLYACIIMISGLVLLGAC